jgi:leader peptidase (prepilin peptidase) / N-methyltransferase
LFEISGFLIGLLFGSFLNVCISRLPGHKSIVFPRSHCPDCGVPILWFDNIPVLSWILLRGRCRDCKRAIPWRYPLVELATGIWFALQAARLWTVLNFYFWTPNRGVTAFDASSSIIANVAITILGFLLIGLVVMDWQTHLLPNAFTLTGIGVGLLLVCVEAVFLGPGQEQVLLPQGSIRITSAGAGGPDKGNVFLTGPEALIGGRILAICGAALLLLVIRWLYKAVRHREGMGLGDVKLIGMIAAFLGFWPAILALFVGVLAASIYGVLLILLGKANLASKLAFGSFLAAGGLFAAQFGDRIIEAYSALMR